MKRKTEDIWAYIQGEMPDDKRRAMEEAISRDPELRAAASEIRLLHEDLKSVKVMSELTDRRLEDRILGELERTHEPVQDDQTVIPVTRSFIRSWHRISTRPAVGLAIAAAACILLVAGISLYPRAPVRWDQAALEVGIEYRGTNAPPLVHTDAVMQAFADRIRSSAESSYAEIMPSARKRLGSRTRWIIGTTITQLPGGVLVVDLSARPADGEAEPLAWSEIFVDGSEFDRLIDVFVRDVMTELAEADDPDNSE